MIDPADESPLSHPAFTPLDPRYRTVLRIKTALAAIVITAVAAIAEVILAVAIDWPPGPLALAVGAASLLAVALLPGRRYRRWRYAEHGEAIEIGHGLFVRFETLVPFGRVQHIDIARGPIERACGLATLALHTAGTHNSTVHLPGLALETAERMRAGIREHIGRESW